MQLSIWMVILLVVIGVSIALLCAAFGAFVVFRGGRALPGERLFGGVSKGQVFSIPDALDEEEPAGDHVKTVLERTDKFLKTLAGGKE